MLPLSTPRGHGFVPGYGDLPVFVRWRRPEAPRARVLLLHGYSEHSGRYAHVLDALEARGFAALAPDHRGHGRTARTPGDLECAEWVLADLSVVHRELVEAVPGVPTLMLAHSMGGLFGLRYLSRHGDHFAAAVINGAAMRIPDSVPGSVRAMARALSRVTPRLPLQPFFDPTRNMRDPVAQQAMRDDPLLYKGRIRARTGAEMLRFVPETWAELYRVRLPVLLTHGGIDAHVPVAVSEQVLQALGSVDKQLVVFDGLLHETHNEPESAEVVATWLDWLEDRGGVG